MRRIFALSWPDTHGPMWMNKDNLETLLRTEGSIDSRIQLEVEDVTDAVAERAAEQPPKPEETKTEVPKPAEKVPAVQTEASKGKVCRFRVSSKCHRFPPKVMGDGKQCLNPRVAEDCWCGEFKEIPEGSSAMSETG